MTFQNLFCFHLWMDALGRHIYSVGPLVRATVMLCDQPSFGQKLCNVLERLRVWWCGMWSG